MIKWLLCLWVMVGLTGCVSQPERPTMVVEQKTVQIIKVDETLLQPCVVHEPPTVEAYMAMNKDAREDAMTRYAIEHLAALKACTLDKRTVKATQDAQQVEIEKFNQTEAARAKAVIEKGKPDGG